MNRKTDKKRKLRECTYRPVLVHIENIISRVEYKKIFNLGTESSCVLSKRDIIGHNAMLTTIE